jgi:hypothetical protein
MPTQPRNPPDSNASAGPDIFPAVLAGLSDGDKDEIRRTFLGYGVSEEDLPGYIAELLGVIETIFDDYIAEKQEDVSRGGTRKPVD